MKGSFLRFFPTPHFLTMKSAGLTITDSCVRYIALSDTVEKKRVTSFGEKALPQGAVERGYVKDPEKLIAVLREVRKEAGLSFVTTSIPEEKSYLYTVEIPYSTKEKEVESSIESTIEENVPIHLSEATYDYDIVPNESNEKTLKVAVSIVPTKVVRTYIDVLEGAGLLPISFELESHATAEAIVDQKENDAYFLVNAVENKTGLYVVSNQVVHYASVVHSSMGTGEKRSGVVDLLETPTENGQEKNVEDIGALVAEIDKVYKYWHAKDFDTRDTYKQIKKVIITGERAFNSELIERLSATLRTNVEQGNVWKNVFNFESHIPEVPFEEATKYATAIGLVLTK